MKTILFHVVIFSLFNLFCTVAAAQTSLNVNIPGTSNPWLAGMPNGTFASLGDQAPAQSPVLVNIPLQNVSWLEVSNATGGVAHGFYPLVGPEGCLSADQCQFQDFIIWHEVGPELGKSTLTAPINSIIGVFLNNDIPTDPVPAGLDFTSQQSRDYLEIHPELKQVFYIGNGQTTGAVQQKIFVPAGATRFFLGTMDGIEWNNNAGAFTATVRSFVRASANRCGNNNEKILVCHKGQTICIGANAVPAHVNHGDKIGECITVATNKKPVVANKSQLENSVVTFNVSNFPNPVTGSMRINYQLPVPGDVVIAIYDATGKQIAYQMNANRMAGLHFYDYSAGNRGKGLYYYQVRYRTSANQIFQETGKFIVVK